MRQRENLSQFDLICPQTLEQWSDPRTAGSDWTTQGSQAGTEESQSWEMNGPGPGFLSRHAEMFVFDAD